MFSKCETAADGSLTIPAWAVDRWIRQMNTDYQYLSDMEKDSDRKEAAKFIKLFQEEDEL